MKSLQEQVNSAPKQHQLDRLVSLVYLLLIPSLFLVEGAELQTPFFGSMSQITLYYSMKILRKKICSETFCQGS